MSSKFVPAFRRLRRACAVAAVVATSVSLASVGTAQAAAYPNYVAMGDSYAASGSWSQGQPNSALFCFRSAKNYVMDLAAAGRTGTPNDVSCDNANTDQVLWAWQFWWAPAQIYQVNANTNLVTLTIGGNDVGFGDIVGCIQNEAGGTLPQGANPADPAPCKTSLQANIGSRLAQLPGRLANIHNAIAAQAPNATVVTTGYLAVMPKVGIRCSALGQLKSGDQQWANDVLRDLNNTVRTAAMAKGPASKHLYVLPANPGYDTSACQQDLSKRWASLDWNGDAQPYHPTIVGQQAMATAIGRALDTGVSSPAQ